MPGTRFKRPRASIIDDFDSDEDDGHDSQVGPLSNQIRHLSTSSPVPVSSAKNMPAHGSEDDEDEDIPLVQLIRKSHLSKVASTQNAISSINGKTTHKKDREKIKTEESRIKKAPKDEHARSKKGSVKAVKKEEDKFGLPIPENKEKMVIKKRETKNDQSFMEKKMEIKKEGNSPKNDDEEGEEEEEYKWWLEQNLDGTIKWETLQHSGIYFPPEYVPHKIKMRYGGKDVDLFPEAEEVATFYAGVIGSQHEENPTFRANFFADFLKILKGTPLESVVTNFEECDFTPIYDYLQELKEQRKNRTKEEKEKEKEEKSLIQEKYGYCIMDGRRERVGNFRVEPPGLFRGRGDHPKTGCLKVTNKRQQNVLIWRAVYVGHMHVFVCTACLMYMFYCRGGCSLKRLL